MLDKSIREIERERQGLQTQEKKLIAEIKKNAKQGQMGAVRVMAKDLIRTRHQIDKLYKLKSQLQGVSLRIQPEHQQLIVDAGALPRLVDLLKRDSSRCTSRALNGVIRRAADAITNLAHENSNIKSRVRIYGGIPPLVHLLESGDAKVQRAVAGTLRTLAFKNDDNKNQIVECNVLTTLVLMLRSEDSAIHYEAVGVFGNLVHSSPNIKRGSSSRGPATCH